MTREDITRMAREAGLGAVLCHNSVDGDRIWIEGADWHDEAERFAALVAEAEREEILGFCERMCEAHRIVGYVVSPILKEVMRYIRERRSK